MPCKNKILVKVQVTRPKGTTSLKDVKSIELVEAIGVIEKLVRFRSMSS